MRTQFTFYKSYEDTAECFEDTFDRFQWYRAIVRKALYEENPVFTGGNKLALEAAWKQVEAFLNASANRSSKAKERMKGNQNARKDFGSKGKKTETPPEKEPEPVEEPKAPEKKEYKIIDPWAEELENIPLDAGEKWLKEQEEKRKAEEEPKKYFNNGVEETAEQRRERLLKQVREMHSAVQNA